MTSPAPVRRPADDLLAADTAMGPVTLLVGDLENMTGYYRDAVGLDVLSAVGESVELGRGSTVVVRLSYASELRSASPGSAGLFHTAIVFDDHAALAASVASVAAKHPGTFVGSADHLVSEAFYFTDPEGNGVELYVDRPRESWRWTKAGVQMDTLRLDPNGFLRKHLRDGEAVNARALVGHVHLSVGDVGTAERFYVQTLGFERTAALAGSALFVSAGGYHHHMAMNTWNSAGAGRRAPALGLGSVDIVVPTADDRGALAERVAAAGIAVRDDGAALTFADPWGNLLRVSAG